MRAGVLALVSVFGAGASALAQDHFSGRYRSVSGADHDVIVVAPSEADHWLVALERVGWVPTPHPGGQLIEAPPARMAQWFGAEPPPASMRCLVPRRADAWPVLCSLPPGTTFRFLDDPRAASNAPVAQSGWLLIVRTPAGVDVTDLVRD